LTNVLALYGQTPTIDQSLGLKTVSGPRMSPDGRFVAYVIDETNWEEDTFDTQIGVVMTSTGERYQLTHAKKSSTHPRWSPDSKRLAFLSDRDGSRQIYIIAPTGGEATELTHFDGGIRSFEWAPDGHHVAFLSTGPETKSRKDRKEKYGDFELVGNDYAMVHLWLLSTDDEKAKPEPLTSGDEFSVAGFAWSPDSKRIAFSAARDPDLSSAGTADLYVVPLSDKYVKMLVESPGPDRNPVWSPNGSEIAYETAAGSADYLFANSHVAIVSVDGGPARLLGAGFDEAPQLVSWSAAGIYFEAMQRTSSHLFRLNPVTGAIDRVSAPADLELGEPTFNRDFTRVAFTCAAPGRYNEVCVSPLSEFSPHPVTNMSDQLKPYKLATRELFAWKSKDGTPLEGILIKPRDFDAKKKYPLLVVIHGGPRSQDRPSLAPDRNYPTEMFAAKGAVILRPNYRGSAGYGEKFRALSVGNLGFGDAEDVSSGVDALVARGFVDGSRVGVMGWSEGGYISAFLTTYTDRFKAVSIGAGIADWITYYVTTDLHPFTRQYLKGTPWMDPDIYRKTSPITYVTQAKTPTLIQHGELDKRVPVSNAYELYQALKDRGVPVRMIVYRGFGHAINRPKQQRAVMEHNYEWFSQWIWNETPPGAVSAVTVSAGGK